ncbi:SDR family NAD(P)-dependent oxidoreductase [Shewanella intestini]|uniref:SDR family NAD(P)-dependent oxidoreductase n=1 Tax=Shewanella intestini TaxID=2017544 RepID=A0ABS5HYQ5_9GAMM|nr:MULTISPECIES: SDR family NAD(P)-dependent oxidoreductase [Shewanella]MBR9726852.1 SDR family NAD(P)-dependent oxidoreductase [Shewanella intestini]MRG34582.1 SDR family NAD(P)-dependent oxidoreductase [Shewanella sp. XMDDZSB0408]
MSQTTAMLIGASSQLSQALAQKFSEQNVELILFAQDPQSIKPFTDALTTTVTVYPLAIEQPEKIIEQINHAWKEHNGAHLVLVNTGLNGYDPQLPWQLDQDIIDVNVKGYAAICNASFRLLCEQGYGQLASINSIAGLRGGPNVAYHASKAFAQSYLEGLSMHAQRLKLPVTISDIQLGLLDKAAMQGQKFWLPPIDKVANQIIKGLKKGKRKFYVTKRWRLVAWLTKGLPEFIYNTRHWNKKAKKKK